MAERNDRIWRLLFYFKEIAMNTKQQQWEAVYDRVDLPWTKNPLPTDVIEEFISRFKTGDRILDYGCGDGWITELLMGKGLAVVGSDISDKALQLAKQKMPELEVKRADRPSEFSGEAFDGILSWGVMHHIPREEWETYMEEYYGILTSGGTLLISGHSRRDEEFKEGFRISPTTKEVSHAVDEIGDLGKRTGFTLEKEGYFEFDEAFTDHKRALRYFFLRK